MKNFALAHKYLEAAYASVQKIENTIWNAGNSGHFGHISPDRYVSLDLTTDILMKLATSALELHDYDQVQRWTAKIFGLEPYFFEAYTNDWCKDTVSWASEAYYTAYYCSGVALQVQGKIDGAIQHFEKALVCNDANHAVYDQLHALRQIKAQDIWKPSVEEIEGWSKAQS